MEDLKKFVVGLCAAAAVGLVSIIFVFRWVLHFREGLAWDGGLAEFNWHPVLMVTGFIFLQGMGEWNKVHRSERDCNLLVSRDYE